MKAPNGYLSALSWIAALAAAAGVILWVIGTSQQASLVNSLYDPDAGLVQIALGGSLIQLSLLFAGVWLGAKAVLAQLLYAPRERLPAD